MQYWRHKALDEVCTQSVLDVYNFLIHLILKKMLKYIKNDVYGRICYYYLNLVFLIIMYIVLKYCMIVLLNVQMNK